MPANKEKPLIIPPTSQGHGAQFTEDRIQNATRLREVHPIRFEAEKDFDVIANLYNEYYGKMALNFPDVIANISGRRLTQAIKVNRLPFSEQDIAQLTSHVVRHGFSEEYRELEVAFDYYVR